MTKVTLSHLAKLDNSLRLIISLISMKERMFNSNNIMKNSMYPKILKTEMKKECSPTRIMMSSNQRLLTQALTRKVLITYLLIHKPVSPQTSWLLKESTKHSTNVVTTTQVRKLSQLLKMTLKRILISLPPLSN